MVGVLLLGLLVTESEAERVEMAEGRLGGLLVEVGEDLVGVVSVGKGWDGEVRVAGRDFRFPRGPVLVVVVVVDEEWEWKGGKGVSDSVFRLTFRLFRVGEIMSTLTSTGSCSASSTFPICPLELSARLGGSPSSFLLRVQTGLDGCVLGCVLG